MAIVTNDWTGSILASRWVDDTNAETPGRGNYFCAIEVITAVKFTALISEKIDDDSDGEAADDEGCSFILVSTALFEKEEEDGETSDDLLSPTEPPVFIEGIDISTGEEVDEVWKGDLETGVGAVLYDS